MDVGEQFDSAPGAHRLLLAPFFLMEDLLGALLPGLVLVVLLFAKGEPSTRAAFATTIIGYKTKVACVILISYVIGKAIRVPLSAFQSWLSLSKAVQRVLAAARSSLSTQNQTVFDKLDPDIKALLGGVVALPISDKLSVIDFLAVFGAQIAFSLSTGTVLLIASLIPGNGILRWAELAGGILLFVGGMVQAVQARKIALALFGMAAAKSIIGMSDSRLQALLSVGTSLIPLLTGTPASPKKTDTPEPPKTDVAGSAPIGEQKKDDRAEAADGTRKSVSRGAVALVFQPEIDYRDVAVGGVQIHFENEVSPRRNVWIHYAFFVFKHSLLLRLDFAANLVYNASVFCEQKGLV